MSHIEARRSRANMNSGAVESIHGKLLDLQGLLKGQSMYFLCCSGYTIAYTIKKCN